ncbi:MAG: cation:proton antiporter [Limnospira sp. PMC 1291.21]|uniref:cation:proton antiporter domain-containing protein n=1 Tax=Limnospira TaxID=2596745 RepID=UPI000280417B|nr:MULTISPECIES: cation:proton antiporter [Limnospira]EKD06999.1 sodium/hydrogen exchanger [Arthrospira platensis C1]MDT9178830.1 cation:proton antiporter [Limnospira sp. PMC 1238.20]MDT9192957.1 cation:proton antiporter [Limnospira sp. PMC 1245.20]MDT9198082.1 cation:proton antiporter [Limnospira sp. PMC 1042.18]MDT9203252.1 cation:proton antiporter [Limnospira sp. PMC 1243.20]
MDTLGYLINTDVDGFSMINLTTPLAQILSQPIQDPVAVFLIIMGMMLIAPLVFERIKLPGIVGLILAGVIIGPHGIGLLARDNTIVLLGTVGLLFLMFLAGLETSLDDLKLNAKSAFCFGLLTFLLPMILGTIAMMALGYSVLAAILVASCFASHTLLALPILNRLGIMRASSVTATLGGTLITNVLALLVLAIVVKAHRGDLTLEFWLFLIPALTIYTFASLWGVPKIGRWFFRKFGHDEGAEFTFVVATLLVASYVAQLIEIEPIIGAFLAGIALTPIIPNLSPLMNRIQFIGNTLFIPFFLISVGMLIDPLILIKEPRSLLVAVVMIVAEFISKYAAAWTSGKVFGWPFPEKMVCFGLSVAQAASTLAAITVAFNIELVDELTVNGIIAMILFSCIASPWIVNRWGKLVKPAEKLDGDNQRNWSERVLVPVANPSTEDNLLQLAILLVKKSKGTLLPLNVISDKNGNISSSAKTKQSRLLSVAEQIAHAATVKVESIARIDAAISRGIVRSATERNATLIICGWKGYSTYQENFFGSVIDQIIRRSPVPVLITRFPQPLENTERVFMVFNQGEISSWEFKQTLEITKAIAEEIKAKLHLLVLVTDYLTVDLNLSSFGLSKDTPVQQIQGNFIMKVSRMLKTNDLLLLTPGSHENQAFGFSRSGLVEPETIVRAHSDVATIVVHFPKLS